MSFGGKDVDKFNDEFDNQSTHLKNNRDVDQRSQSLYEYYNKQRQQEYSRQQNETKPQTQQDFSQQYPTDQQYGQNFSQQSEQRFGQQHLGQNGQHYGQQSGQQQLTTEGIPSLSQEDVRLLRQCNRESFYYRCLPFAAVGCGIVYALSRQKTARASPWQYMATAFTGWLLGKLSYRKVCEDRLANSSSNSPLVRAIRRRRGMYTEDYQGPVRVPEHEMYSDWSNSSKGYGASEFTEDKDDSYQQQEQDNKPPPRYSTTYEELRARNRSGAKF